MTLSKRGNYLYLFLSFLSCLIVKTIHRKAKNKSYLGSISHSLGPIYTLIFSAKNEVREIPDI